MKDAFRHLKNILLLSFAAMLLLTVLATVFYEDWIYEYDAPSEERLQVWLTQMDAEENENLTAARLREHCESENGTYPDGLCAGYMLGFVEGFGVSNGLRFCVYDEKFSASQMEQVFQNFMAANPQYWNKPRSPILGVALQEAFPCTM